MNARKFPKPRHTKTIWHPCVHRAQRSIMETSCILMHPHQSSCIHPHESLRMFRWLSVVGLNRSDCAARLDCNSSSSLFIWFANASPLALPKSTINWAFQSAYYFVFSFRSCACWRLAEFHPRTPERLSKLKTFENNLNHPRILSKIDSLPIVGYLEKTFRDSQRLSNSSVIDGCSYLEPIPPLRDYQQLSDLIDEDLPLVQSGSVSLSDKRSPQTPV